MADGFAAADKSRPFIANNSLAKDRGYRDGLPTATCLCGGVQLAFVSHPAPLSSHPHTPTRITLLTNPPTSPSKGPA